MRPSQRRNPIPKISDSNPANEEHGEYASSKNEEEIVPPAPYDATGVSPYLSFHEAEHHDEKIQRAYHPEPGFLLMMNGAAVKTDNNFDTPKCKLR
ncbi:hypothetical protein J27TS7_52020 [Paenibacillus dendritiformis]|nr:hypothetical protein J27TS7_52020 [Paenibacillus dendritiformis]